MFINERTRMKSFRGKRLRNDEWETVLVSSRHVNFVFYGATASDARGLPSLFLFFVKAFENVSGRDRGTRLKNSG